MCTTLSWEYRDQCASQLGKHAKVDRQVKAAWVAGWVGALRRQVVLHGAGCRKGGGHDDDDDDDDDDSNDDAGVGDRCVAVLGLVVM